MIQVFSLFNISTVTDVEFTVLKHNYFWLSLILSEKGTFVLELIVKPVEL